MSVHAWMSDDRLRYEVENHPDYSAYERWKHKYPGVLKKFEDLAMECVGKKKYFGMWLIANKLRWDYWWTYNEEFKICDHFTALITRELMLQNPNIKEYCSIKKMTWADDKFDDDGKPIYATQNCEDLFK